DGHGGLTWQRVNVVVQDANEAPVFDMSDTSHGNWRWDGLHNVFDTTVNENTTLAWQPTVTDQDQGQTITYSIVPDQYDGLNKFTIDPSTGAVSFINAPDFENPTDEDHDGFYNVVIRADDGHGGVTDAATHVYVQDVPD